MADAMVFSGSYWTIQTSVEESSARDFPTATSDLRVSSALPDGSVAGPPGSRRGDEAEAETGDDAHRMHIEKSEDEYYVTIDHEMSKTHFISFILAVKDDGLEFRKLYPEGNAEARFGISRTRALYCYCNRHGLFRAV